MEVKNKSGFLIFFQIQNSIIEVIRFLNCHYIMRIHLVGFFWSYFNSSYFRFTFFTRKPGKFCLREQTRENSNHPWKISGKLRE